MYEANEMHELLSFGRELDSTRLRGLQGVLYLRQVKVCNEASEFRLADTRLLNARITFAPNHNLSPAGLKVRGSRAFDVRTRVGLVNDGVEKQGCFPEVASPSRQVEKARLRCKHELESLFLVVLSIELLYSTYPCGGICGIIPESHVIRVERLLVEHTLR